MSRPAALGLTMNWSTSSPMTKLKAYATASPTTSPRNAPLSSASFRRLDRMSAQTTSTPTTMAIVSASQLRSLSGPSTAGSAPTKNQPTAASSRMNDARRTVSTRPSAETRVVSTPPGRRGGDGCGSGLG